MQPSSLRSLRANQTPTSQPHTPVMRYAMWLKVKTWRQNHCMHCATLMHSTKALPVAFKETTGRQCKQTPQRPIPKEGERPCFLSIQCRRPEAISLVSLLRCLTGSNNCIACREDLPVLWTLFEVILEFTNFHPHWVKITLFVTLLLHYIVSPIPKFLFNSVCVYVCFFLSLFLWLSSFGSLLLT